MAKSTRSKVKRHFRAKKREEGVYAATEAARVERLAAKLAAKLAAIRGAEKEDDVAEEAAQREEGDVADEQLGSFALLLGVVDADDITADTMRFIGHLGRCL